MMRFICCCIMPNAVCQSGGFRWAVPSAASSKLSSSSLPSGRLPSCSASSSRLFFWCFCLAPPSDAIWFTSRCSWSRRARSSLEGRPGLANLTTNFLFSRLAVSPANASQHERSVAHKFVGLGSQCHSAGTLIVLRVVAYNWYQPLARFDEVEAEEPKSAVGLARKAAVQDLERDREVTGSQEQLGADQVGMPMSNP